MEKDEAVGIGVAVEATRRTEEENMPRPGVENGSVWGDGKRRGGVVGLLVPLRKPEALDSRRPPQLGHVRCHMIAGGLGKCSISFSFFLFFANS